MKVLWLCSLPLPEAAEALHYKRSPYGGWMVGLSGYLCSNPNVHLTMVAPVTMEVGYQSGSTRKYDYDVFPLADQNVTELSEERIQHFEQVIDRTQPDIIHIFGTEFVYCAEMGEACARKNLLDRVVVNLQGIMSEYARVYTDGLSEKVIHHQTIREVLRHDSIAMGQKRYEARAELEKRLMASVHHVIGRTDWDRESVLKINPSLHYHFCGETLRDSFYYSTWKYSACVPHSVFVSQAGYPIKGFHMLLQAMPAVLKKYPDFSVSLTGNDIVHADAKRRFHMGSYPLYLRKVILENHLENHIYFLGTLDEDQMRQAYLSANASVCPSTVENSSNSIGEAMLMGVPVIASRRGGTPTLIQDGINGYLYDFEDTDKLAELLDQVFAIKEQAEELGQREQEAAKKLYDPVENNRQLLAVYQAVLKQQ